jgi:GNAT superfamily N-acetyltransferase
MAASATATQNVTLRPAEVSDTEALAQICFDAFGDIHDYHRFQRDFPSVEAALGIMSAWIPHPEIWGVVAEVDGEVVGSNFLDERDPIRGVGPITIAPAGQNKGVGRRLMQAVIERGRDSQGVRLLQDGFHMRSLSLYASLGFDVTDPVVVMSGTPAGKPRGDIEVRAMAEDDLDECTKLCEHVHGFARTGSLRDAIHAFKPFVAVRDGRIVAYASALTFWPMAHGVAETYEDMQELLLGGAAQVEEPISLLVPLRAPLFRWSLEQGLRAVKPMNIMVMGAYQEPAGAWFPSVLY